MMAMINFMVAPPRLFCCFPVPPMLRKNSLTPWSQARQGVIFALHKTMSI
jgi:hypothetical protein